MDVNSTLSSEETLLLCFKNIIEDKVVQLDIGALHIILNKNLGINLTNIKPKLKSILPYMLVHFIKSWPGWKKTSNYHNKQITFENWFQRFKEYLIFKINFLIKNDYDKALAMLKLNSSDVEDKIVEMTDSSTQTNPNVEKTLAPFKIQISGPPKVLNSLVFCEGPEDSVLVKEYRVNSLWEEPLKVRQLINWPYMEVEFKSKHLHFKRTNKHDFKRCLTFSSEKIFFKKSDTIIEEIDLINEEVGREAYTLNAIKQYCQDYICFLRSKLKFSEEIQKEIEIVLEDFMLDIMDINLNSIATNTKVFFNIGNAIYARNKSIKTSNRSICFGECLIPKLELSLYSFTGIIDHQVIQFDEDSAINLASYCPTISYKCTFCKRDFCRSTDLWNHLQQIHVMEQPVLCFKCKQQFSILDLSYNRWYHTCDINKTKKEEKNDSTKLS